MPRTAGTYTPPAGNPVVVGTDIDPVVHNNTISDIGNEITKSVCVDGTSTITADIPMNSKKFTGLPAGTTSGDSVEYAQMNTAISAAVSAEATARNTAIANTAQTQTATRFSAGGTADAITGSLSPAITGYTSGLHVTCTPPGANTSTAPTLNLNSQGNKTIKKKDSSGSKVALVAGDYNQSGPFNFEYDGTDFILLDPLYSVKQSYVYIREEQTSGTQGGTFTSGAWQTRTLNTEVSDADNIATLSSNQVTLAAGTYIFKARCPAVGVNRHKCRLQNITDSSTVMVGSSQYTVSTSLTQNDSVVNGRFTLAASKALSLQHYCEITTATYGFGSNTSFGAVEVFSEIEFWKVA